MDKKHILYKPAKIYTADNDISRVWFVHFSYRRNPADKFKRIKITGGINRIADKNLRYQAAKILRKIINRALQLGWQPGGEVVYNIKEGYNIVTAITDTLNSKKNTLRKRSFENYQSSCNDFIKWLKKENMQHYNAADLAPHEVQRYIDYLLKRKLTAKSVNTQAGFIHTIFARLHKLRIIPDNPFTAIDKLPEVESNVFEIITDAELTKIMQHLKNVNYGFYLFCLHIYYCYLRPASIVQLKVADYNLTSRKITLPGSKHKNRKQSIKQILQPLHDALLTYGIEKIPANYFLIGENFKPGQISLREKTATKQWKKLVIDGLGINKKMYALKHTGGTHYLSDNAGKENIAWLKNQMGHSSLKETDIYVTKNADKFLNETNAVVRKL